MHKATGDAVIGGTVNMGGALRIRASRCAALRCAVAASGLGPALSLHLSFGSSMAKWNQVASVGWHVPDMLVCQPTARHLLAGSAPTPRSLRLCGWLRTRSSGKPGGRPGKQGPRGTQGPTKRLPPVQRRLLFFSPTHPGLLRKCAARACAHRVLSFILLFLPLQQGAHPGVC